MEFLYLVISISHAEGHISVSLAKLLSKKNVLRTKFAISPHSRKIHHINYTLHGDLCLAKCFAHSVCVCMCKQNGFKDKKTKTQNCRTWCFHHLFMPKYINATSNCYTIMFLEHIILFHLSYPKSTDYNSVDLHFSLTINS